MRSWPVFIYLFFKCFEQCFLSVLNSVYLFFKLFYIAYLHLNEVTHDLSITVLANNNDPGKVLQKHPLRVRRIKQ